MDNMFELIAQPASGEEKKPEARFSIMVRLSSFGRICFEAGPCLSEDKEEFESLEYRHRGELFSHFIAEPFKIKWAHFTSNPVKMKRQSGETFARSWM